MSEIETILNLCSEKSGIADITSNIKCEADKQFIVLAAELKSFKPLPVKLPGETTIPMGGGLIISKKASQRSKNNRSNSIVVNQEIIKKYGVLTVGSVKPGDFIKPLGMKRDVKIHDVFSSAAIPKIVRNSMPIVRAGAVPIWIPGLQLSECLRNCTIDNAKNSCMILTFKNGIIWQRKNQ
jgi:tRNA(Ile)-lysidine synthase